MNGINKVTAGLPPEYQPRRLEVTYASGETLCCTTDNDPDEIWAMQVCDVFANWFHENQIPWDIHAKEYGE